MNVVLIISDTLRRDFLGCYGNNSIHTPYIDRFAENAIVFDKAQAGSFPTVPCRNDIMTGRWTLAYKPWSPLGDNETILSEVLNAAGYITACFVDVPNAFRPDYNYQRGFQAWEVIRGQERDSWKTTPIPKQLPCDPTKLRYGGKWTYKYLQNVAWRRSEEDYFPARTMRTAASWLEENRGKPFFLYVDTFDPHEPWDPPAHYLERYEPKGYEGDEVIYPRYDKWEKFMTKNELDHCRNLYAGEVSLVDRWVGFLLERIQDLHLWDETTVIITSDHGFYLGEHGYIGKSILTEKEYQSLPLYPEVSNIPFLIRIPGIQGSRRCNAFAQHVDIMPTVLELLGVPIPKTVQGKSVIPALDGGNTIRPFALSSPTLSGNHIKIPHPTNRATMTSDEWVLIWGAQVDETEPELTRMVDSWQRKIATIYGPVEAELYHLPEDPWCNKNIISEHWDVAKQMHSDLVDFFKSIGVRKEHLPYFEMLSKQAGE